MTAEGMPYTGFLYAGLMMTSEGPKILEYNVRLGDPETQAIMHSLHGDFLELLNLVTAGSDGSTAQLWNNCSVCLTLAAANYPDNPRTGDIISGIAEAESLGATVFHAGTKTDGRGLVTAGGRVLGVTASAETLPAAIETAYAAATKIHFHGMHYRTDIGRKGLIRW
jgi:phosphoribosylamine--glycine ligase